MKANNTFLRSVMGLLLLAVGSSAHATTYTVADQYALLAKADGLANQQVSLSFSAQAQSSLSSALLLLVQVNNQVVDFSALSGGQFNRTYQLGGQPITSLLLSLTSWGAGYLVSNVSVSPFSSGSLSVKGAVFSVPEPGTLALMGIGLLGVSLSRRCRSTQSALLNSQAMP